MKHIVSARLMFTALFFLSAVASNEAFAIPRSEQIGFDPPLGRSVPLAIVFEDEAHRSRSLGQWIGGRPTIIVPVYFGCKNLCDLTLTGLADALRNTNAADQANVLVVSIDPREQVSAMRAAHAKLEAKHASTASWRLLHGEAASIDSLTRALGFRYFYDEPHRQFAHAAGLVVVDGRGRLVSYFAGVRYDGVALRKAVRDAAAGAIQRLTRRFVLACFDSDPSGDGSSARIVALMRVAGAVSLLALGGSVAFALRRERRAQRRSR